MRLEIFCKDRQGLVRELLDLLVARNIDLYGIEIVALERLYLRFSAIAFEEFSSLMAEIRRTPGVTDVRTVTDMPSERERRVLTSLLEAMPEPVLSIDLKDVLSWLIRQHRRCLVWTNRGCITRQSGI